MFPKHDVFLETLARSAKFDLAEVAIDDQVVPLMQQMHETYSWIVMLARFKGEPAIVVGTPRVQVVTGALQPSYGGVSVLVFRGSPRLNAVFNHESQQLSYSYRMGSSISTVGGYRMGTLGPYVQLRETGELCALTCNHVAGGSDAMVVCPGEADKLTMIKNQEELLLGEQARLVELKQQNRSLAYTQRQIAEIQARLDILKQRPAFGRVVKSIYRLPTEQEPTMMDCSLIKVAEPETFTEEMVQYADGVLRSDTFQDPSELDENAEVIKRGRSSGLTRATTDGYKPVVSLTTLDGVNTLPFKSHGAWNPVYGKPFSEDGDSGAAIVNPLNGSILGMMFGGASLEVSSEHGPIFVDVTLFHSVTKLVELFDIEPVSNFAEELEATA